MKKSILMVILVIACSVSSQAQNIIVQQNNMPQQNEKVIIKEKEVPVFVEVKETAQGPICLHGYLYVYPEDLGWFKWYPGDIINSINIAKAYGRNNWRLPTWNELQVMRANRSKIGGYFGKYGNAWENYMFIEGGSACYKHYDSHKRIDGENELGVRLVSTN